MGLICHADKHIALRIVQSDSVGDVSAVEVCLAVVLNQIERCCGRGLFPFADRGGQHGGVGGFAAGQIAGVGADDSVSVGAVIYVEC